MQSPTNGGQKTPEGGSVPLSEIDYMAALKLLVHASHQTGIVQFEKAHPGDVMPLLTVIRNPNQDRIEDLADELSDPELITEEVRAIEEMTGESLDIRMRYTVLGSLALGTARYVSMARRRQLGDKGLNRVGNAISTKALNRLGWNFAAVYYPEVRDDFAQPQLAETAAAELTQSTDKIEAWAGSQLSLVYSGIKNGRDFLHILDSKDKLSEAETAELRAANDELFTASQLLRGYTVKPAIAPSPTTSSAREWHVISGHSYKSLYRQHLIDNGMSADRLTHLLPSTLANFVSTNSRFTASKLTATTTANPHLPDIATTALGLHVDPNIPATRSVSLSLCQDGDLSNEFGYDLLLYSIENGRHGEYEQLRAELLGIYYDLVVPIYITKVVDQTIQDETERAERGHEEQQPVSPAERLRRLVVARTVVLKQFAEKIPELMAQEKAAAKQETERRRVDNHSNVVGHIRRINPLYRASEEARKNAREEIEVELADYGETYVKDKSDDDPEKKSRGHRLHYRQGGSAALRARRILV